MGIDLAKGGRGVNKSKKLSRSSDVYLNLLVKVTYLIFSFILSSPEELRRNSIKLC